MYIIYIYIVLTRYVHWTGKISFVVVFFFLSLLFIYVFFYHFFSQSTWMHYNIFPTPPPTPTLRRYRIPTALELWLYNRYTAHRRYLLPGRSIEERYVYRYLLYCFTQRVMVQYYYCVNFGHYYYYYDSIVCAESTRNLLYTIVYGSRSQSGR